MFEQLWSIEVAFTREPSRRNVCGIGKPRDFIIARVHRVAANDIDYRTRAARGSVCNALFAFYSERCLISSITILQTRKYSCIYHRGDHL